MNRSYAAVPIIASIVIAVAFAVAVKPTVAALLDYKSEQDCDLAKIDAAQNNEPIPKCP